MEKKIKGNGGQVMNKVERVCRWIKQFSWDFEKVWITSCKHKFIIFKRGDNMHEDIEYCPYCGKKIKRTVKK
jgi:hypothetical protein